MEVPYLYPALQTQSREFNTKTWKQQWHQIIEQFPSHSDYCHTRSYLTHILHMSRVCVNLLYKTHGTADTRLCWIWQHRPLHYLHTLITNYLKVGVPLALGSPHRLHLRVARQARAHHRRGGQDQGRQQGQGLEDTLQVSSDIIMNQFVMTRWL